MTTETLAALIVSTLITSSSGPEMKAMVVDFLPLDQCQQQVEVHTVDFWKKNSVHAGKVLDVWASCQIVDPLAFRDMLERGSELASLTSQ